MAKQAFIALLLIIAIWIAPTHATAPNVKAEAATGRKLVENFQDQKVEELIKLPHKVMVPSGGKCYYPDYDQCDPGCVCIPNPRRPWPPPPGSCVCPRIAPTHSTAPNVEAEAATGPKLVENFRDQKVEELIKLPHKVMVPSGETCYPPNYDECDPGCICIGHPIWPPRPGICACPMPPTLETARKMVGKFQDQTVTKKLIKLVVSAS